MKTALASAALVAGVAGILLSSAEGVDWAWLPRALGELFSELPEATHPVVAIGGLIGLATLLVRRIHPPVVADPEVPSARPEGGGFPVVCLQLFLWGILLALHRESGYISQRHLMLSAASLAPLACVGMTAVAASLALASRRLGRPIATRIVLGLVLSVSAALMLSHASRPLHEKKEPYRRAAEHLARLVDAGDVVLVNSPYIAYYGNVPTRPLPAEDQLSQDSLLRSFAAPSGARLLVLSRADSAALGRWLATGRLREELVFRLREDRSSSADVIIYTVGPIRDLDEAP